MHAKFTFLTDAVLFSWQKMGGVVSKVKHGFEDVGNFIKDKAEDVGNFVAHRAENVYHAADDVVHGHFKSALDEAKNFGEGVAHGVEGVAKLANKAIVTVGHGVAGVISHVPGVGGTLAKGIDSAMDLAHEAGKPMGLVMHAVEHPVDAFNTVKSAVEHPSKLIDYAKKGIHYGQRVAGDISNVAAAVAKVNPELAPELGTLSAVTGAIAHPSISSIGNLALKEMPDSNAKKIFTTGVKVAKHFGADGSFQNEEGPQPEYFRDWKHVADTMQQRYPTQTIGYHFIKGNKRILSIFDEHGTIHVV